MRAVIAVIARSAIEGGGPCVECIGLLFKPGELGREPRGGLCCSGGARLKAIVGECLDEAVDDVGSALGIGVGIVDRDEARAGLRSDFAVGCEDSQSSKTADRKSVV